MTIIRYQIFEVWDAGNLILTRIVKQQPELGKKMYAVLDGDRDILSTHETFSDALVAVTAEMILAGVEFKPDTMNKGGGR